MSSSMRYKLKNSDGSRFNALSVEETEDDQVMNEHLTERFGHGSAIREPNISSPTTARPTMTTNLSIRKYVKIFDQPVDSSDWTTFREVPSSSEIFDEGRTEHTEAVEVHENIVVGPYSSKSNYLERQYSLLREDAVASLRDVVSEVQAYPRMMESESDNDAYVYEKVFITGFTFARAGIAARVTFSLRRSGKKVNWEQSKRLLTGSIVALTSAKDNFKTICHVAVIAARPLEGLNHNPPEIDIFFAAPNEIQIDPQEEWLMVESRNGFYEGHRHTLQSLQMLAKERFPLSEHIVDIERNIKPPKYVQEQPLKNLSKLFAAGTQDVPSVDILNDWPTDLPSDLDESQMEALTRILAKRLAIVQGPPGTGKTHVSVIAIRLLLENMAPEDPPILLAAHTNHALDQLLRLVSKYEPDFIRLGGWTKDMEIIKPRTLYEVKEAVKHGNPKGSLRGPALTKIKQLSKELIHLLSPLTEGTEPLKATLFKKYGVISDHQYESLIKGAKEWIRAGTEDDISGDVAMWLGDERVEAKQRTLPEDFGIEVEEVDLEFEQLKEIEAENKLVDEEDHETLRGPRMIFNEPFTGRQSIGVSEQTVVAELEKKDMWQIPSEYRGPVYRNLQKQVKECIQKRFQEIARQYAIASKEARIGLWELDQNYLKQARVIGMTTTGLSKYRGLLQSLDPKVVLIEEAAETLEAPIAVACFETIQHLILVGDHQQLRAHCNDQQLAGPPFYLGVSMFERLVRNKVEFSQLKRQRRMIPEIRRALRPIYSDLEDHPSVFDRSSIPGMGGINSYFFTHKGREMSDAQMSKTNPEEADMIVAFFQYLVTNGTSPDEITVLTFYNGQRKLILKKLRERRHLLGDIFKVVTVDSYQGEENTVVLLSLVRSNSQGTIGFLGVENRVCVALSRAKSGFYLFGDAPNLCKSSMLWWEVVQIMSEEPRRIGFYLPLTCEKHKEKTFIQETYDFNALNGGCVRPCKDELACGHICKLNCHPFPHEAVNCQEPCPRTLECGHACTQACFSECSSDCECGKVKAPELPLDDATRLQIPSNRTNQHGLRSGRASPDKERSDSASSGHVSRSTKSGASRRPYTDPVDRASSVGKSSKKKQPRAPSMNSAKSLGSSQQQTTQGESSRLQPSAKVQVSAESGGYIRHFVDPPGEQQQYKPPWAFAKPINAPSEEGQQQSLLPSFANTVGTSPDQSRGYASRVPSPQKKPSYSAILNRPASQIPAYSVDDFPILGNISHQTQGYRDYAAGGHVASDKSLAALQAKQDVAARQKRLDEDNYRALFPEMDMEGGLKPRKAGDNDNVKLVRTMEDGKGGNRGRWEGTFRVPKAENKKPGKEEEKREEVNLLDL